MAERWPAAVLLAPRALSASNPAALDVEAAGIVRAPSASPLNILHVLRAPLGGLFRHVVDLVQGQAARGHRVGLIVDSTTGGARAETALAALAPHLALGVQRVAISVPRIFKRWAAFPAGSGRWRPTCCTATAPKARRWRD
jgi:hypothetical protein